MSDLNFIKSFLTEDLYILKEEQNASSEETEIATPAETKKYEDNEVDISSNKLNEPVEDIKLNPLPAHLGSFKKKILITVHDTNNEFISDGEQVFLLKILGAVKLTLDDVAIANTAKIEVGTADLSEWSVAHYLSFTGETNTSLYEPLLKENIHHLSCHRLNEIAADKTKKQQLWTALQRLFLK